MRSTIRLILLLVLLPAGLFGQDTSTAPALKTRPAAPANATAAKPQVTMYVQVTDKSGTPIRGLSQQDFTLLDNKHPQNIDSFQAVDGRAAANVDAPAEIVMVVDAVNAGASAVAFERDQMRKFLLRDGGELSYPVSLVVLTDAGAKMQPDSSRDGNKLAALYDRYETGLRYLRRGFYDAEERFDLSIKAITSIAQYEEQRPGRKLVIWLSPGWPLFAGPNIEFSNKEREQVFSEIVAQSTMLRQAGITLYSVDPLGLADAGGIRTTYYENFVKAETSAKRAQPAELGLQVLATQSGGRVLYSSNDLAKEIGSCAADAGSYYVLSFVGDTGDKPSEYHELSVKVDKPGVVVRTRNGYYAQP